MKKNVLNLITFVLILVGCTNAEDSSLQIEKNGPNYVSSIINVDEAIEISHKVLKHSHVTRNVTLGSPVVDYVLNGNVSKTRNASLRDTLAYVINYPNDEGFVIVSSDRRVYPVLAYSDKGNFSFSNEAVKSTFINNIGNYISSADATVSYEVNDNDFQSCYSQTPMIEAEFSQGSPWNKYVIKEHPNCPAGCVALATSLVLSHSMTYVYNYHGLKFNFKSILKPIIKAQNPYDKKVIDLTDPWESVQQPEYSYQQAVDSMALFIYWIGKDLNTKYGIDESSASSADAYNLCRRLRNGEITNCEKFNLEDICKYVKDKYIVYLWGYDIKELLYPL